MSRKTLVIDCPECRTRVMAAVLASKLHYCEEDLECSWREVALMCPSCERMCIVHINTSWVPMEEPFFTGEGLDTDCWEGKVSVNYYPDPEEAPFIAFVDDDVKKEFLSAEEMRLGKKWEKAIENYRKVIDLATKERIQTLKLQAPKPDKLYADIELLGKEAVLPPKFVKCMHWVREFGNKAIHGTEISSLEELLQKILTENLAYFTGMVLAYLYFLPGKITETSEIENWMHKDKEIAAAERRESQDTSDNFFDSEQD